MQLDFKEGYKDRVSNVKLIIENPENCYFIENSILVGNFLRLYEPVGNIMTIPLPNYSDIVRLCVAPTMGGEYAPNAFVEFDYNGRTIRQPIGSVLFSATDTSINVPENSSETKVTVSGTAAANSDITVYDNGAMVGQARANSAGNWSLNIDLFEPSTYSYHLIYADIKAPGGVKVTTESKLLKYNMNNNGVSKVTMYNSWQNQKVVFDFLNPSTVRKNYTWWSSSYSWFTFTVEFIDNDPEFISDVVVNVKTTDNKIVSLPASYDERQNLWVTTGNFPSSRSIPADVFVDFKVEEKLTLDTDMLSDACDVLAEMDIPELLDEGIIEVETISNTFDEESLTGESFSKFCLYDLNEEEEIDIYINFKIDDITPDMLAQIDESYLKFDDTDGNVYYYKYEGGEISATATVFSISKNIKITAKGSTTDPLSSFRMRSWIDTLGNGAKIIGKIATTVAITAAVVTTVAVLIPVAPAVLPTVGAIVTGAGIIGSAAGTIGAIASGIGAGYTVYEHVQTEKELNSIKECLGSEYNTILSQLRWNSTASFTSKAVGFAGGLNLIPGPKLMDDFKLLDKGFGLAVGKVNSSLNTYNTEKINDKIKNHCLGSCHCGAGCTCGCGGVGFGNGARNGSGIVTSHNNGSALTAKIDPSGYIYEAVASNRLQGVTVTAFHKEDDMVSFWEAAEYDEENPIITDNIGWYAWDVPSGLWQVKAELDGYQTAYSEWLPVPPPQVDVNIPMVSYANPYIEYVNAYEDGVEIAFNKYMQIPTLALDHVVVKKGNDQVDGRIELINAEENPADTQEQFASKIRFVPDEPFAVGDDLQLTVKKTVESYSGVGLEEDYVDTLNVGKEVTAIEAEDITMALDDTHNIVAVLEPNSAAAGKKILVQSNSPQIATASSEAIVNQEGRAIIPVTAQLPGSAYFTLELEGTDLRTEVMARIELPTPTQISYTAVQTGGTSGTADSMGIQFTFSQTVTGLTSDKITITNGTGSVVKGALNGSGTTWTIALTSIAAQGDVTVNIADFSTYHVTNSPKTVAVYKDTANTIPTVTGVTVSPNIILLQKGETQQFNAVVEGANSPAQTVSWNVSGNNSNGTIISNSGELTVDINEAAATLTVTATSTADNTKFDAATVTVDKATGAAVSAPVQVSKTANSITVSAAAPGNGQTVEYAHSNTSTVPTTGWQDSGIFSGLTEDTEYFFYARSKENNSYSAGAASHGLSVRTDSSGGGINLIPVTNKGGKSTVKLVGATINLTAAFGLFTVDVNAGTRTYTLESGGTGIGTITENNLYVTKAGTFDIGLVTAVTTTHAASTKVIGTLTVNSADQAAPKAPTLKSKTINSVTLNTISGAEYRRDNGAWQSSTVFVGLKPNTTYNFYARLKETATRNASPISAAFTVTTDKITSPKKQLKKPTKLKLTSKKATWKGVKNNSGYTLKIMQGKKVIHKKQIKKGKTSYTIPKKLFKKGKKYRFTLMAKGKGDFKNSKIAKSNILKIK